MKSLVLIFVILVFACSCSTLKKSIFYGGLGGMALGISGGASLSPDKESRVPNMAVWGSIGALLGAGLGYIFFTDDPENRDLPNMILPPSKTKERASLHEEGLIQKVEPTSSKKYKLETGPLPPHLKGKVKTPVVIEHDIPETIEQLEGGKTITVEQHKAWEIDYE